MKKVICPAPRCVGIAGFDAVLSWNRGNSGFIMCVTPFDSEKGMSECNFRGIARK